MQVLCKSTDTPADIYCSICNKGFNLFWERTWQSHRADLIPLIQQVLHDHHNGPEGSTHPEADFNVPSWAGQPQFSAAALLGGAY